ncbi:MAG: tol-pal system-associated acyl-CoA thioesterase [Rhodospirillales bacterium]|nr:MAG: tol-pal system-associated acyl-CoA thioesterase [Rhodospirillales bacterium]
MTAPENRMRQPVGGFRGLVHVLPVRIYYEDTDAGGIVYFSNYLKFAERARTEMMRHMGVVHPEMIKDHGRAFAVRRCEADYLRPARLDDLVEVHSHLLGVRAASLALAQDVRLAGDALVRTRFTLACMSNEGRAVRIPEALRAALEAFVLVAESGNGTE